MVWKRSSGGGPTGGSACHCDSGRPVAASTSSARETRCLSPGSSCAAVSGSFFRNCPYCAAGPSRIRRSRISRRTSSAICGIGDRPCISARKYSPVPPHRIGSLPDAYAAAIASMAISRHHAAEQISVTGSTPYSRCGRRASSAGLGRAVRTRRFV